MLKRIFERRNLERANQAIDYWQLKTTKYVKERRTVKVLRFLRYNSAFVVVLSSALVVSATNLATGRDSSGFLFGYFGAEENTKSPLEGKILSEVIQRNNLAVVPLAMAKTGAVIQESAADNLPEKAANTSDSLENQVLTANTGLVLEEPAMDGGVKIYEVKDGDTVESIAKAHGVTVNTIKWSNEIDDIDSIYPGDKIFILPVSGLEYTVKNGDTMDEIAEEYKADKERIIAFNNLPANGAIEAGQEIIIPGGIKDEPVPVAPAIPLAPQRREYTAFNESGKKLDGKAGTGHKFPFGYCTWYVASRRYIPWSGNAGAWLYRAKAMGYKTGKTPRAGSIVVTSESPVGHVAIVEKVDGNTITISEMNFTAWGKVNRRTLSAKASQIRGYIY